MDALKLQEGSLIRKVGENKIFQVQRIRYRVVSGARRFIWDVFTRNINNQTEKVILDARDVKNPELYEIVGYCKIDII